MITVILYYIIGIIIFLAARRLLADQVGDETPKTFDAHAEEAIRLVREWKR